MYKIFKDKKIIVTGHTGFKGSWLSLWLSILGAKVTGISDNIPTVPSNFKAIKLDLKIEDLRCDINDLPSLEKVFKKIKPDFIFHLAAQSLVNESYYNPLNTFKTNGIGTLNILDSIKRLNNKCVAILITSDKCYFNKEWIWGYRETDEIGGLDPYSGSKGVAELIIRSYYNSFFYNKDNLIKIGIGRAGNVIGGGDWANNRIVPDIVKSWSKNKKLTLRNPNATRPWQHVLEPLSGYLRLAKQLYESSDLNGEAFNFGPASDEEFSVLDLVKEMSNHWPNVSWTVNEPLKKTKYESQLLKLNCDKALAKLKWKSTMTFSETVKMTAEWYKTFYQSPDKTLNYSLMQIKEYQKLLTERSI
tara:strand:+ start:2377 stop:3456 length:1080 start_codon:yes stop_codon:yes gene_type:complete